MISCVVIYFLDILNHSLWSIDRHGNFKLLRLAQLAVQICVLKFKTFKLKETIIESRFIIRYNAWLRQWYVPKVFKILKDYPKWDRYRWNRRWFRARRALFFWVFEDLLMKISSNRRSFDRSTWTRVRSELFFTFSIMARRRARWCISLVSCPVVQATSVIPIVIMPKTSTRVSTSVYKRINNVKPLLNWKKFYYAAVPTRGRSFWIKTFRWRYQICIWRFWSMRLNLYVVFSECLVFLSLFLFSDRVAVFDNFENHGNRSRDRAVPSF